MQINRIQAAGVSLTCGELFYKEWIIVGLDEFRFGVILLIVIGNNLLKSV
jgi:hypothetical protein